MKPREEYLNTLSVGNIIAFKVGDNMFSGKVESIVRDTELGHIIMIKTKKLYGYSEPDFFWYFTASFNSGYRHFQEDTVSFRSAYELGKEFFDKKNTIAY